MAEIPQQIRNLLKSVRSKRARIVISHILEHGSISTEELEQIYGYKHPPRAAADVREAGIPLETFHIKNTEGQTIAAYRFGDLSQIKQNQLQGRKTFPKALKTQLLKKQASRCAICDTTYDARYLQIDHRIPYRVAGEVDDLSDLDHFMLLCASCNRSKSWSCENCPNGTVKHDIAVCALCYWASPSNYQHIATEPIQRIILVWRGQEVQDYNQLVQDAKSHGMTLSDFVKYKLKQD